MLSSSRNVAILTRTKGVIYDCFSLAARLDTLEEHKRTQINKDKVDIEETTKHPLFNWSGQILSANLICMLSLGKLRRPEDFGPIILSARAQIFEQFVLFKTAYKNGTYKCNLNCHYLPSRLELVYV